MGEIIFVGPGKTRGYPYPVCKKHDLSQIFTQRHFLYAHWVKRDVKLNK